MDALARDEDVARFTRVPDPVPDGFGERWVERYTRGRDEGTNAGFAIVDAESGDFLGFMALVKLDLETQEAEAGYIVASHARGRGVATRALRLLTAWAFDELPLERIELLIDVENSRVRGRRAALRLHARRRAALDVPQAGPALGHDRLLEAAARARR